MLTLNIYACTLPMGFLWCSAPYVYGRYIKMALCQIEIKESLILLPFIISFLILSWLNFIPPLFVLAQQDSSI